MTLQTPRSANFLLTGKQLVTVRPPTLTAVFFPHFSIRYFLDFHRYREHVRIHLHPAPQQKPAGPTGQLFVLNPHVFHNLCQYHHDRYLRRLTHAINFCNIYIFLFFAGIVQCISILTLMLAVPLHRYSYGTAPRCRFAFFLSINLLNNR